MNELIDAKAREEATNPNYSYIVQAPAGSGKTEILTQRYLRLLSMVTAPEQIVALTFTKKAANEMRERITLALLRAEEGIEPTSLHLKKTHHLATKALEKSRELQWNILKQPSRLRINTIDSLCQTITNAIPLKDKQIHQAQIIDNPKSIYQKAARECLLYAMEDENYHAAIKILLRHIDNQQPILIELFTDLLAERNQWLNPLYQAKQQDKAQFEYAIQWILQHELARFKETIPNTLAFELIDLARQIASIENNPQSKRYPLQNLTKIDQLNATMATGLTALLLTSQNQFRKSFDHHVGLKRGVCDDSVYDDLKNRSKQLLVTLEELPDFLTQLLRVSKLPEAQYEKTQWEVLQALFTLLPLLVAHLNLAFIEANKVDFNEISELALRALGTELKPTDLTLYLDNQIKHLLIDEFQDTSMQQFQLIQQLVSGWEDSDSRTLFVVGDPMQSIYRFRAAEVGIFLRTKTHGIGPVKLTSLSLSSNFRSKSNLVNWVNQHFKQIFPQKNDIESGAVTFHPSVSIQSSDESHFVSAQHFTDKESEANALVNAVVLELEKNNDDTLAILVRSRRQLEHIINELRARNIPFQGVDIDLLSHLPHIRDVYALTEALLQPSNRLAWLTFLRSPWCGISLQDLHILANFAPKKSIYFALSQLEKIIDLSDDGLLRLQYIANVMQQMQRIRAQQSLVDWILTALKHLHLEHVLTSQQQEDCEQYWILLEKFDTAGQITDLTLFKQELQTLYSKNSKPSRLQIMTIHKSKGLEFDCVFLPGLGAKSIAEDRKLLRWLQLPTANNPIFLISPIKPADAEKCKLYDYLGSLSSQKDEYEMQRLLYVAVTRAKKRLYLFDHNQTIRNGTFRHLLQAQVFTEDSHYHKAPNFEPNQIETLPTLYRLPSVFYTKPPSIKQNYTLASELEFNDNLPRLKGIVTHELLQWICTTHKTAYDQIPWHIYEQRLLALGFQDTLLEETLLSIKDQIARLFSDPIGNWIIAKHQEEKNEYELLVNHQGNMETRIIDRTFVYNNQRVIIDFKTGLENISHEIKHRKQVEEYAALFANNTDKPIMCGLYYLASGNWLTWEYICCHT